ncbi:MAG: hypothetical protein CVT88_04165 [Candidatus Altiarchaeales archaeon HGW-Altiarchaeales-1]|nr:MAG: hypothetical protein CVT88_04165 [Candidatus Altiarchaeales archaeon HGW-Altiarchaeales-1]
MDKIFTNSIGKLSKQIGNFARVACILEVTTEKPGNVTPTHDFADTKFENFIFGSMLIGDAVEKAFTDGYKENFNIGKRIHQFAKQSKIYNETNTHFGIVLLFIPLATALGMALGMMMKGNENEKNNKISDENLRNAITHVMKKTNVDDAIYFHKAVKMSNVRVSKDFGIDKFDILSENFIKIAKKENINLYHLLKISADKDIIARDLTTKMEISFEHLDFLKGISRKDILSLYLLLLSKFQDTLIMKKRGSEISENVSEMAKEVINGNLSVEKFSDYLYINNINPGTIADITANVVFLYLLKKFLYF